MRRSGKKVRKRSKEEIVTIKDIPLSFWLQDHSDRALGNYSSTSLTLEQKLLLSNGPNFIPLSSRQDKAKLCQAFRDAFKEGARRWLLMLYFQFQLQSNPVQKKTLRLPSTGWIPESSLVPKVAWRLYDQIQGVGNTLANGIENMEFSLPKIQMMYLKAIRELKRDTSRIIKLEDKGGGLIILDCTWYETELDKHMKPQCLMH